jgi:hypothetical protein
MAIAKLGFNKLGIPAKIQVSRNIVTKMTGNAKFPTPSPTLASITTATTALETAFEAARDGGKSKTAFMKTQVVALSALMMQLMSYVQQASLGDEVAILSTGMEVKATKSPPPLMPAPLGLLVTTGNEGAALLKWDPVIRSKAYVIQQSADGSTQWTSAGNSTKRSAIITGLVSGSKIWFRVAAIGAKGQGPWCEPTRGMAG